jgi:hypothetical protein
MPFDNPHHMPLGDVEIVRDARSRIADEGNWLKYDFQDGNRHCLVGALSLAAGSANFRTPNGTERRLARHLVMQLPKKVPLRTRLRIMPVRQRLMYFNDDARTTHDDVVALYDRAIERLSCRAPICTAV